MATLNYSNGTYVGDVRYGLQHGIGTYTWNSGATYTGDWLNGSRTGTGTYTWNDGDTYTGDFVDGFRTGTGTFTWWDTGNTYTGDFVDGSRTGTGTYTWNEGMSYNGGWIDGMPTGTTPYREGNAVKLLAPYNDAHINAVLYEDNYTWFSNSDYESSQKIVITYSFIETNSDLFIEDYSVPNPVTDSVVEFDAIHQAAVLSALATYESFLNVEFRQVNETEDEVGTIRFGFTDHGMLQPDGGLSWGWATAPGTHPSAGDIWVRDNHIDGEWGSGYVSGSYNYGALMHEIGHALGLAHPHEGIILDEQYDFSNYTIMSYNDPDTAYYTGYDGIEQFLVSSTPMVLDVAALQYLYGASDYNVEDSTYTFDQTKPFVKTIWDSGGTDTLDFNNFNTDLTVSLTAGVENYSTIPFANWRMEDNLGLAYGTIIENANGGSGDDLINGNAFNNLLNGYSGDDVLYGGAGDDMFDLLGQSRGGADTFYGGLGDDKYYVYASSGFDRVVEYENEGEDTISLNSISEYTLPNHVEALIVSGNNDDKNLTGNNLNNTIISGGGNDFIYGLEGDDSIYCGPGQDVLSGGEGSDNFYFYLNDGHNIITDFSVSNDTCFVVDNSGALINVTKYDNLTETQNSDGNAELRLNNETTVTLEGVAEYLSGFEEPAMTYLIPEGGMGWISHSGKGVTINTSTNVVTFNDGIGVTNNGTGSISINSTKSILGGFGQTDTTIETNGIYAWNKGQETKGISANVADVSGLHDAIILFNDGTGDVTLNSSGSITGGRNNTSKEFLISGVWIENSELASNVNIDVNNVTSTHDVILVSNLGTGSTTIDVRGTIISQNVFEPYAQGIDVRGAKSVVTVHANASVTGEAQGISLTANYDNLTINGSVDGKSGVAVLLGAGDDTATLGASADVTGEIDGGAGSDTANFSVAKSSVDSFTYNGSTNIAVVTVGNQITTFKDFEYFKFSDDTSSVATADVSSTLTTSSPVEKIGAISTTNTGSGSNISLDFYVDNALIVEDVTSFDMVVSFDGDGAEYVSASLGDYLGVSNVSGETITLSGISIEGLSSSNPLFALDFTDLDTEEDFVVSVSDVVINGTSLDGSTFIIGTPNTLDVEATVVARSGAVMSDVTISFNDGGNVKTVTSNDNGISMAAVTSGGNLSVTGSLDYAQSTRSITSQDALDALRLSVGMDTQGGTSTAFDYIAADFNQDGKVSSQDALAILKYAVGLSTTEQAEWVFVDSDGDYSGISSSNTNYDEGVNISKLISGSELGLTGILIGDVNDTYSSLIA